MHIGLGNELRLCRFDSGVAAEVDERFTVLWEIWVL
jgi:hypothetical protein